MADSLTDLVHRADLDGLVRHVDAVCAARDWEQLVRVRDASRAAVETGRQLWPIATLANYRLALWAPAEIAVRSLDDAARTFMPGPVSEILAQHHTWDDLEPHLAPGHDRSLVAHERALRGDAVDDREPSVLDVPMAPLEWEPRYVVATYDDDGAHESFPEPDVAVWRSVEASPSEPVDDPTTDAFRQMMTPWTAQSNGTARAAVARGDGDAAVGALGLASVRLGTVAASDAMSLLAWAAASGGARGRRRGLATGRGEAWWLVSVFLGVDDEWPVDPDEFGALVASLECHVLIDDEAPTTGWGLGLVLVDRDENVSCALVARDGL